jgi:hypothetical protein
MLDLAGPRSLVLRGIVDVIILDIHPFRVLLSIVGTTHVSLDLRKLTMYFDAYVRIVVTGQQAYSPI